MNENDQINPINIKTNGWFEKHVISELSRLCEEINSIKSSVQDINDKISNFQMKNIADIEQLKYSKNLPEILNAHMLANEKDISYLKGKIGFKSTLISLIPSVIVAIYFVITLIIK